MSGFFEQPDHVPSPGSLIRVEPIVPPAAGTRAWRLMYSTTGASGAPVAATTMVVVGEGDAPGDAVVWAHGSIGIQSRCLFSPDGNPYWQTPSPALITGAGYILIAPEYPGLGTSGYHYFVGEIEAHAVLDAVRAVTQFDELRVTTRIGVWGASQGGHTALWAAHRAARYAPELELVGTIASAPAVDLVQYFEALRHSPLGAVPISQVMFTFSKVYPEADLDLVLKPDMRHVFDSVAGACLKDVGRLTLEGGLRAPAEWLAADPVVTEPWAALLAANSATVPVEVPLLFTHGTHDPVIPIAMTESEVARRRGLGEQVEFIPMAGVTHDGRDETVETAVGWLKGRFGVSG